MDLKQKLDLLVTQFNKSRLRTAEDADAADSTAEIHVSDNQKLLAAESLDRSACALSSNESSMSASYFIDTLFDLILSAKRKGIHI